MTDKVKGFVVTLGQDVRIDDVEPIMNAIRMISGVADVSPSVADFTDHSARMRVKSEVREKLLQLYESI